MSHGPMSVYSNGPPTPWDEEVVATEGKEGELAQQEGETYAQFEDRVNNKRAAVMYRVVKAKLDEKAGEEGADRLLFSELVRRNNRKQVAQKFYTALVLKKLQMLELEQESAYSDLVMTRGPAFSSVQL